MTQFLPILPSHIDSTMLTTFRSCPRKFFNEFVRGMRPSAKSIHLHAGACFASTLEHIYRKAHGGLSEALALASGEAHFTHEWGDFVPDHGATKTPARMWEAIVDYIKHYGLLSDPIQPYRLNGRPTFEYSFAVPLDGPDWPTHPVTHDPFIFCGRFDMLGEYHGLPIVRDEKTTSAAGESWANQWDLRGQFLGYLWACRAQGIAVDQVAIRGVVIQKTQIRQLQLIRPYTTSLVDRWLEQTRRDLWRICDLWTEAHWDMNFGDACVAYGRCMFTGLCEAPEQSSWEANFTESRWNPLLRDPLNTETTHATAT